MSNFRGLVETWTPDNRGGAGTGWGADSDYSGHPTYGDIVPGTGTGATGTALEPRRNGGSTIYRLREGIERFTITDINNPAGSAIAQSEIPVMWDNLAGANVGLFNHVPGGANVLYMDGHVRFIKYPAEWPCTKVLVTLTGG